jgi:hypothetical protein
VEGNAFSTSVNGSITTGNTGRRGIRRSQELLGKENKNPERGTVCGSGTM